MRLRNRGRCFWIAIVFLMSVAGPDHLLAQATVPSLSGQVLDPSGAAVVGATVSVTTPARKKLTLTTNGQGAFELRGIPAGKYAVEVTAAGFAPYKNADVEVSAERGQQLKINLEIQVEEQKVEVESEAPTVEVAPQSNAGAIVISGKELDALPDDPDELQSDLTALAGPSAGPNGGQFYIDGFTAGQLPPKSAIREIRINQNPFSAEYDKVGYGRIEIFTKPGTDKWHGQVSVNANDSAFNSKNPFFQPGQANTPYPSYYSTQFSGNVGGPLSKKASLFLTADHRNINDLAIMNAEVVNPQLQIVPFSAAVPTPKTRLNIAPRLDYQISKNNTLSVRYQYYRDDQTNAGIGGFTLPSQAYNLRTTEQTVQVSGTQVLSTKVVNETHFQYLRDQSSQLAQNNGVSLIVQGAFNGGGSNLGNVLDTTNHYELQNYTSIQLAKHFIKFGGRLRVLTDSNNSTAGFNGEYVFPSIQAYQAALASGKQSASQFSLTAGSTASTPPNPFASVSQVDAGLFVQDDWRIRPNMTFSYGLRFETQNNISNRASWAPRLGFAWGLSRGNTPPKTVLRAGFGIFYDRYSANYVLQDERLNGINQAQFVFTNPNFFPNVTPTVTVPPSIYLTSQRLRAPGVMQTAVSIERQLTKIATLSVSYLNSRGWDQLLTNNINTPIPGTYVYPFYLSPTPGIRPIAGFTNIDQYQSEAIYRENQLFVQATVRAGAKLTLFSYYTLTYANSDTAGANSFPSNPRNLLQDYGPVSFDIRNRYFLGGTIALPYNMRVSPFMIVSSGNPYNVTLSQDLIGSTQFNQRPGFANGATGATDVSVAGVGTFNTVPPQNEAPIPVGFLTGPGRFTLNLRLSKTFGFGGETTGGQQGPQGGAGGGGRGGRGGGGPGGPFGGSRPGGAATAGTNHRYNLTFSVNARNIFNHVNAATPTAVLNPPTVAIPQASASSFFAIPNALAGGPFSSNTANRLIYLQVSFGF